MLAFFYLYYVFCCSKWLCIPKESADMFYNITPFGGTICLAALIFYLCAPPQTPIMQQFFYVSCRGTLEPPTLTERFMLCYVSLRVRGSTSVPPKETWKLCMLLRQCCGAHIPQGIARQSSSRKSMLLENMPVLSFWNAAFFTATKNMKKIKMQAR